MRTAAKVAGQPQTRKDLILERAEQHFADHGFQGASLSAIARDCEVGNPGLLHHFPSKEALYRAVLEKQAGEFMGRMHKRLEKAASLQERLQAYVALQLEWMQARPTGFKLVTHELLDNAERIQQAQARPFEKFLLDSLALMDEARAAGLIRPDLPAVVALTIILGTLNYAKMARPTFAKAFADPMLKSEAAWMKAVARNVLAAVSPTGWPTSKSLAKEIP